MTSGLNFDLLAYEIARLELQDLGYFVPIQYWGVKAALSLHQVKRSGGDFQVGALSTVMGTPHVRALTLSAWEGKVKGRKTLVFCASVRHAHQLAADYALRGLTAARCSMAAPETARRFSVGFVGAMSIYCSTTVY